MLKETTQKAKRKISESIQKTTAKADVKEVGFIHAISAGTAVIKGFAHAKLDEMLLFEDNCIGMVQTIHEDSLGVVFLSSSEHLKAGDKAVRTGRVVEVPVSEDLLGRVINPLGEPLDGKGKISEAQTLPVERESHPIIDRAPVDTPLQTGIKAIDSFTPIGRGQRELILGDRQTGKTAIALDTMINQKGNDVICIYCAIGQQASSVAKLIADTQKYGIADKTIIVVASGDDEAGMQYIAPYAATTIGEYFMEKGKDVLVVYDDLTNHARAYREMSLLLRRPPGREAFPGDIFYIHSRLLERATHLNEKLGGGSLTALPIVSTEAGNISAYIPTNIISITDGQIYLSASLFQKGIMPAIDTGRSVSRVGGDAQLPSYKKLIGPLKLFYSQFEELESFAKFGTQLDDETKERLNRGRAIRLTMEQRQYQPMPVVWQIAILMATNNGLLDGMTKEENAEAQKTIQTLMKTQFRDISKEILEGKSITQEQVTSMLETFRQALNIGA